MRNKPIPVREMGSSPQYAEEVRLLYVGMTRATHELHLSASAESPFVETVERAIARL